MLPIYSQNRIDSLHCVLHIWQHMLLSKVGHQAIISCTNFVLFYLNFLFETLLSFLFHLNPPSQHNVFDGTIKTAETHV